MTAREDTPLRRVWVDVENPPQVQFLAPLAEAFARLGVEVIVTARDHGLAHELLRERSIAFHPVGAHPGGSTAAKTVAGLRRAAALARLLRRRRPDAALFTSRAAALAAPLLRTPGFVFTDYEFSELRAYRLARSYVVHPAVVRPALLDRGFDPRRLISYAGIKEDITFSGVDPDAVVPHRFVELDASDAVRVLFRPPDDRSHYFREASADLARDTLERLAAREDVVVVFSPRYPEQVDLLRALPWRNEPVVVRKAIPFLELLMAVDAVITGGGTMAREAAYLGVASYSVFKGELGEVDRFLESQGRLVVVRNLEDVDRLRLERRLRAPMLASNPSAIDEVVAAVSRIAAARWPQR